jgi:hypothetical protein
MDEAGTGTMTIGFAAKTTEALVRIEAALGHPNPAASVKDMEAKISAQLKWSEAAAPAPGTELEDLLRSIEETMRRAASGAR